VIYEPDSETMPREQLRALQGDRLSALLEYARVHVPLYCQRLAGVEVQSLDDLRLLPFTRKEDLRDT
jgi:phenylacetate-CoA ligase